MYLHQPIGGRGAPVASLWSHNRCREAQQRNKGDFDANVRADERWTEEVSHQRGHGGNMCRRVDGLRYAQ
jgi:hypothetical protein